LSVTATVLNVEELVVIVTVVIDGKPSVQSQWCYWYDCWLFFVTHFGTGSRRYEKNVLLYGSGKLPDENV